MPKSESATYTFETVPISMPTAWDRLTLLSNETAIVVISSIAKSIGLDTEEKSGEESYIKLKTGDYDKMDFVVSVYEAFTKNCCAGRISRMVTRELGSRDTPIALNRIYARSKKICASCKKSRDPEHIASEIKRLTDI
jgi:hypothetical protein